jgi:hypothetical protein
MSRVFSFGDEAGNFDFRRVAGATRYFILTTVTMRDCSAGDRLLELRRQLAWEGIQLNSEVHASESTQVVRDRVFAVLAGLDFRVDATIYDKAKLYPRIRSDLDGFYKLAWFEHFKYVAPRIKWMGDELLVVAASIGTRKKQAALHAAVEDVVDQVAPFREYRTAFWAASSDPCLWVADFCCWAIYRKWERSDVRSYDLIKARISSEYDMFRNSATTYY